MRPPFTIGNHSPLIDAFMWVPYTYHHPHHPLPLHDASIPLVVPAAVHLMPMMTKELWFVLSAHLSPDVVAFLGDTSMLVQNGVLAYWDVRDQMVNTKSPMFDGGNQQHQLLFKTADAHCDLELHLHSAINLVNVTPSTLDDYSPVGYISFVESVSHL